MATGYNRFYDQLASLVDSINHDSDPAQRLNNLQQFAKDASSLAVRSRDDAAYELRSKYAGADAEILAGINRKYIDYWARRHMIRNRLPRLKNKYKIIDVSDTMDLS